MRDSTRRSLVYRMRSAEGHLRSVTRMVEEGRHLEQVLHQLIAVQGAVGRIRREITLKCVNDSLQAIEMGSCPEESSIEVE